MNNTGYQICNRCVMDTSVPDIVFDKDGICNYCTNAIEYGKLNYFPNEEGKKLLSNILDEIREDNKNSKYDCILGLSGGVDSSYLAHIASKEWDLRILAVHVNAGWNSEIAEANIEKIVNKNKNIDLYTYVVNWQEVRDLQLAYFKSGIANLDVPQDHVFFAQLYKRALKEKIKYILTGGNFASESICPDSWGYDAMDLLSLRSIHKKYGNMPLKSYTTLSFVARTLVYPLIIKQKKIRPLNYLQYNKEEAKELLKYEYNWVDYGMKHGESVFTKFFQNYWLPQRFGYDKRKSHFSSLIVSGYLKREEALNKLKEPLYDPLELQRDKEYICNKLEIKLEELENYFNAPKNTYRNYANYDALTKKLIKIKNLFLSR